MNSLIKEYSSSNSSEIKLAIKAHVNIIKEKEFCNKKLDFDLFEKVLGYVYKYHKKYINNISNIESILFTYGNPYGITYNEINWNPSISVLGILRLQKSINKEYKNMLQFYKIIQQQKEFDILNLKY